MESDPTIFQLMLWTITQAMSPLSQHLWPIALRVIGFIDGGRLGEHVLSR